MLRATLPPKLAEEFLEVSAAAAPFRAAAVTKETAGCLPLRLAYDRPTDLEGHVRELMGTPKTKESFRALISAAPRKLGQTHGRVEVALGSPISLAACTKQTLAAAAAVGQGGVGSEKGAEAGEAAAAVVHALAQDVTSQFIMYLAVPPGALTAAVLLLHRKRAGGVPVSLLRVHMGALRRRAVQRGTCLLYTSPSPRDS